MFRIEALRRLSIFRYTYPTCRLFFSKQINLHTNDFFHSATNTASHKPPLKVPGTFSVVRRHCEKSPFIPSTAVMYVRHYPGTPHKSSRLSARDVRLLIVSKFISIWVSSSLTYFCDPFVFFFTNVLSRSGQYNYEVGIAMGCHLSPLQK